MTNGGGFQTDLLQRGLGIDAEDGTFATTLLLASSVLQRGLGIDAEDGPRARWTARRPRCFNGASASMPRMATSIERQSSEPCGFNGASASMPRMG